MKRSRKAIAITSGVVFAFSQFAVSSGTEGVVTRLIIGGIFGIGIAVGMIQRPDRISRNHIAFVVAPLLAALVAWVTIYESENLLATLVWAMFFLASQVAFLMYPSVEEQGSGSNLSQ